jgi:hypothetical protein
MGTEDCKKPNSKQPGREPFGDQPATEQVVQTYPCIWPSNQNYDYCGNNQLQNILHLRFVVHNKVSRATNAASFGQSPN